MKLKCAIKEDGTIVGNLGFFTSDDLHTDLGADKTVELSDTDIPKGFDKDEYTVVSGKLKKKSAADIEAIKQAKKDAKKPTGLDALKAIDASGLTGDIKTVVEFLQGLYG
jgi:hypothetical protein